MVMGIEPRDFLSICNRYGYHRDVFGVMDFGTGVQAVRYISRPCMNF